MTIHSLLFMSALIGATLVPLATQSGSYTLGASGITLEARIRPKATAVDDDGPTLESAVSFLKSKLEGRRIVTNTVTKTWDDGNNTWVTTRTKLNTEVTSVALKGEGQLEICDRVEFDYNIGMRYYDQRLTIRKWTIPLSQLSLDVVTNRAWSTDDDDDGITHDPKQPYELQLSMSSGKADFARKWRQKWWHGELRPHFSVLGKDNNTVGTTEEKYKEEALVYVQQEGVGKITLLVESEDIAKRLAKAFNRAAVLCGAKEEDF